MAEIKEIVNRVSAVVDRRPLFVPSAMVKEHLWNGLNVRLLAVPAIDALVVGDDSP